MAIPATPSNLIASTSTSTLANILHWVDDAGDQTGFNINRKIGDGNWDNAYDVAGVDDRYYTDANVDAGLTYTYVVLAVNDDGNSVPSNEASVEVPATGASWYYGDLQAVQDLLGAANLSIGSDLEDTLTGDAATTPLTDGQIALIQRDGKRADAYFNSMMGGGKYVIPIAVGGVLLPDVSSDDETGNLFHPYSAMQVAIYLNEHRKIQSINSALDDHGMDKKSTGYQKQIDDFLEAVKDGSRYLLADPNPEAESAYFDFGGDSSSITAPRRCLPVVEGFCWY